MPRARRKRCTPGCRRCSTKAGRSVPPPARLEALTFHAAAPQASPIPAPAAPPAAAWALWRAADLGACDLSPVADAFFEPAYDARLEDIVRYVVALEAPVLGSILCERIAGLHGMRNTVRVQERVQEIAARGCLVTAEEDDSVVWPAGCAATATLRYRPAAEMESRSILDTPMVELRALAAEKRAEGLTGDALSDAVAQAVGIRRLVRGPMQARLAKALA